MPETTTTTNPLYTPLPQALGGRNVRPTAAAINTLLPYPANVVAPPSDQSVHHGIRHKTLQLSIDPTLTTPSAPSVSAPSKKRGTKRGRVGNLRRELPQDERKHALYEPLKQLWLQYARQLYQDDPSTFPDRVIRMDLHGASVTVVRAKDPGLVGTCGILISETANAILLITEHDRLVTVPKNVAVIAIAFDDVQVEIFLPALAFRASERSARKIKKKHMPFI